MEQEWVRVDPDGSAECAEILYRPTTRQVILRNSGCPERFVVFTYEQWSELTDLLADCLPFR